MKLYTTVAEIEAALAKFKKAGTRLQDEAHKLCCSVLAHVNQHGNVNVVDNLLGNFPDAMRANAARAWFEEFGPIAFDKASGKATFVRGKLGSLNAGMAKPFWKIEAAEGGEYKPVDPDAAIHALIKKLEKDSKKTGIDHSDTIKGLRLVLQVRAGAFRSAPVLRLAA